MEWERARGCHKMGRYSAQIGTVSDTARAQRPADAIYVLRRALGGWASQGAWTSNETGWTPADAPDLAWRLHIFFAESGVHPQAERQKRKQRGIEYGLPRYHL